MIDKKEVEEIKKLINNGFDIELIAFELGIPIDEIKQRVKENNEIKTYSVSEIREKKNNEAHLRLQQIREKYRKIYLKSNTVKNESYKVTSSSQEKEILEEVIKIIEEKIQEIRNLPKEEKRYGVYTILSELKKVQSYQLPIEYAERLYKLMKSEELKNLDTKSTDRISLRVNIARGNIINQFAKAIEGEINEIEIVEKLKELEKKLTLEMVKEKPILAGTVRTKISNRILEIQQQKAHERIRKNIPESVMLIIRDLINGNIDIKKANVTIDEEAKKNVKSKSNNKFSLTEQQERAQILIQIRTVIVEKAEEYIIKEPEKMVSQIQLLGGEFELAVRTVVKNLIARKDFEAAKSICKKFSSEDKSSEVARYIKSLRKEVRNAEIGDIVLKAINFEGTLEEERNYYELIEKGLKMGNVKLGAISLGTNIDGTKNITMADVWTDMEQQYGVR